MHLILSETTWVREVIETKTTNKPAYYTINMLAIYFLNYQKLSKDVCFLTIRELVIDLFSQSKIRSLEPMIEKAIQNAKGKKLYDLDYIPITDNELIMIGKLQNHKLEQLMFTLLVIAKFNDMKNSNNNHWVNYTLAGGNSIFKHANITGSEEIRLGLLRDLRNLGLIRLNSYKSEKMNFQVLMIDDSVSSSCEYKVTDFNNLGQQYLTIIRYGTFCESCGKFIRYGKTKRNKMCKSCATTEKRTSDRDRLREKRGVKSMKIRGKIYQDI